MHIYKEFVKMRHQNRPTDIAEDLVHQAGRVEGDEHENVDDDGKPVRELENFAHICQLNPLYSAVMQRSDEYDWTEAYADDPYLEARSRTFLQTAKEAGLPERNEKQPVDVNLLNREQLEVYNEVKQHFDALRALRGEDAGPLLKIFTGTAGTGKSFLISCLRSLLGDSVVLLAPTGMAAVNIRGKTKNSALQIPICGEANFHELKGDALMTLQDGLENIGYVVKDEMSMVGSRKLAMIDSRLRQALPQRNHMLFGGCSFVMIGDFGQLIPIGDIPVYCRKPRSAMQRAGAAAYRQFSSATVLSQVIRQAGR